MSTLWYIMSCAICLVMRNFRLVDDYENLNGISLIDLVEKLMPSKHFIRFI